MSRRMVTKYKQNQKLVKISIHTKLALAIIHKP